MVLQAYETIDARYASTDDILQMVDKGEFMAFHYIGALFEKVKGTCFENRNNLQQTDP